MEIPSESLPRMRFGDFELDPLTRELRSDGRKISLQEQSFEILSALLQHPGQLVTRDELTKRLWPPGTFVDFGHSLNTAVNRLREVLGDSADSPRFIETLPRLGYRFIAPVTGIGSDESGTVAEASLLSEREYEWPAERGETTDKGVAKPGPQVPTARWTRRKTAVIILSLIVVAGFSAYGLHRWISSTSSSNFERLRFTKLTSSGKAEDAAISPDGNYIVYSQHDRNGLGLWLRHVSSGSDVQILPSAEIDFRGLTFSPDGNSIYFVRTRKDIGGFKV